MKWTFVRTFSGTTFPANPAGTNLAWGPTIFSLFVYVCPHSSRKLSQNSPNSQGTQLQKQWQHWGMIDFCNLPAGEWVSSNFFPLNYIWAKALENVFNPSFGTIFILKSVYRLRIGGIITGLPKGSWIGTRGCPGLWNCMLFGYVCGSKAAGRGEDSNCHQSLKRFYNSPIILLKINKQINKPVWRILREVKND